MGLDHVFYIVESVFSYLLLQFRGKHKKSVTLNAILSSGLFYRSQHEQNQVQIQSLSKPTAAEHKVIFPAEVKHGPSHSTIIVRPPCIIKLS